MKKIVFILCCLLPLSAFSQQVRKDTIIILTTEPIKKTNKNEIVKNDVKKDLQYTWLQKKYAEKLRVQPAEIKNTDLYNFVEEWYGTRYVYGGTTKKGVDCSSFVQHAISCIFDKKMERTAYSQHQTTNFVKKEELQEGDLVFFRTSYNRISHVGLYLQNGYFVHASSSRGVMISSINENYWSKIYAGGGRVQF